MGSPAGPPVKIWITQNAKGFFINAAAGLEVCTAGPYDWEEPPNALSVLRFVLMECELMQEQTPIARMLARYNFKELP